MQTLSLRVALLLILSAVSTTVACTTDGDGDADDTAGETDTGTTAGTDDTADTGDTGTPTGQATVRALHGSPDAPAVDIYAGSVKLLSNIAFGQLSDPFKVPAATAATLDFRTAGAAASSTPLKSMTVAALEEGSEWLVIATGFVARATAPEGQGFQLQAVPVSFAEDAGNLRVVAVHAAADAPAVDVLAKATGGFEAVTGLTGLAFGQASDKAGVALAPDAYEIGIAAAGSTTPLYRYDLAAVAGQRAFVVALGAFTPTASEQPFGLYLIGAPQGLSWSVNLLAPKPDEEETTGGDTTDADTSTGEDTAETETTGDDTAGTTETDDTAGTGDTGETTDTTDTTDTGGTGTTGFSDMTVGSVYEIEIYNARANGETIAIWNGNTLLGTVASLARQMIMLPFNQTAFDVTAAPVGADKPVEIISSGLAAGASQSLFVVMGKDSATSEMVKLDPMTNINGGIDVACLNAAPETPLNCGWDDGCTRTRLHSDVAYGTLSGVASAPTGMGPISLFISAGDDTSFDWVGANYGLADGSSVVVLGVTIGGVPQMKVFAVDMTFGGFYEVPSL